jgi:hypothetical protein
MSASLQLLTKFAHENGDEACYAEGGSLADYQAASTLDEK